METPAINLVHEEAKALLGDKVHARFGTEFPIRFDFLDTIGGGNLSLQVHPLTEYIQDTFGMHYTQDESYYILDAAENADTHVYLGCKTGIQPEEFQKALEDSQQTGQFDAERFVNVIPAKKHDHFLIPAGTIHCSGRDCMVLEISATPYIFTFKLWDWGRLGLDGRPRPIHLAHGMKNIQFDRDTEWVQKNLVNRVEVIHEEEGIREERTGLHEREFIETRRHWFDRKVEHETGGSVNVLNLVEGEEAVVESPEGKFAPFVVHYAETFIVPAAVGRYTVAPYGKKRWQASGDGKGVCSSIEKGFRRSAKRLNTRKNYGSEVNSIARKGSRGKFPLAESRGSASGRVWGNAPTVPRQTYSKGTVNKGAGSEASLPVTLRVLRRAPQLLFQHLCCVAPDGRDRTAGLATIAAFFPNAGGFASAEATKGHENKRSLRSPFGNLRRGRSHVS